MESISNYKVTMKLLDEFGLGAKKRLGQNFIVDPSIVEKIAQNCGADQQTTTLEIGPGLGALTQQLAKVSKRVIAVEIDQDMVNVLSKSITDTNVEIIHEDFLEFDLNYLNTEEKLVVCANVPYYITTPILFKLIESSLNIKQITLMVQKEVALRLSASINSKEYNALSVMMDYLFEKKTVLKVPAACFYPKPNVDSMVIALRYKHFNLVQDQQHFFDFVKTCFVQRRKTLFNNLKPLLESDKIEHLLMKHSLKSSVRAQELTTNQFVDLYRSVYET